MFTLKFKSPKYYRSVILVCSVMMILSIAAIILILIKNKLEPPTEIESIIFLVGFITSVISLRVLVDCNRLLYLLEQFEIYKYLYNNNKEIGNQTTVKHHYNIWKVKNARYLKKLNH